MQGTTCAEGGVGATGAAVLLMDFWKAGARARGSTTAICSSSESASFEDGVMTCRGGLSFSSGVDIEAVVDCTIDLAVLSDDGPGPESFGFICMLLFVAVLGGKA